MCLGQSETDCFCSKAVYVDNYELELPSVVKVTVSDHTASYLYHVFHILLLQMHRPWISVMQ